MFILLSATSIRIGIHSFSACIYTTAKTLRKKYEQLLEYGKIQLKSEMVHNNLLRICVWGLSLN